MTVRQPHLLRIGDGASIGSNVNLENVRVERGELVVGSIGIGCDAYVGSYAVMEGDTAIADCGRLEGLAAWHAAAASASARYGMAHRRSGSGSGHRRTQAAPGRHPAATAGEALFFARRRADLRCCSSRRSSRPSC